MKKMLAALAATAALTTSTITATSADALTRSNASASSLRNGMSVSMNAAWARTTMTKLKMAPSGSNAGYSRAQFPHWRDASVNGWPVAPSNSCDTRAAALYRDGRMVKVSPKCTNMVGMWTDPYTGSVVLSPSKMQGDHMVPLANAWRSGAKSWATAKRVQFANDPLVVVSVLGTANAAKGDKGPEAWKPSNKAAYCAYAERWIAVKAKYSLSVNAAERTALTNMLVGCA